MAGHDERNFLRADSGWSPVGKGLNILLGNSIPIEIAQQGLQNDTETHRKPGDGAKPLLFELRQRIIAALLVVPQTEVLEMNCRDYGSRYPRPDRLLYVRSSNGRICANPTGLSRVVLEPNRGFLNCLREHSESIPLLAIQPRVMVSLITKQPVVGDRFTQGFHKVSRPRTRAFSTPEFCLR